MALTEERPEVLALPAGDDTEVREPLGVFKRPTATTGWRSWITTVDHKKIGILYGVTAIVFLAVGLRELGADEERLDAADEEEEQRGAAVEDADLLVVDGREPGAPARRRGRTRERAERSADDRLLAGRELERSLFGDRHQRSVSR